MAAAKIQTGLRLDEPTYTKLQFLSAKENRSMNNLVEYIVKSYIADYEKNNGDIPLNTESD